jgi:hypothetical protein
MRSPCYQIMTALRVGMTALASHNLVKAMPIAISPTTELLAIDNSAEVASV